MELNNIRGINPSRSMSMNSSAGSKSFIIGLVVCTAVLAASGCSKSTKENAYISFFMGEVTVKHGSEPHKAKLKDMLVDGDLVITADKSFAVIQLSGGSVCRVEKNTTLELTSVLGNEKNLTLKNGIVLSKIGKLKKDEQYLVKTPLAIAAVRGTEFMTAYNGTKTTVSVGDGKVNVIRSDTTGDNPVDTGNTAVVSNSVEMRGVNNDEAVELEKLKPVNFIPEVEKKSDDELNEIGKTLVVEDSIPENRKMALDEIRKRYNRIDTVTLYSGKVIKGAILSRGKTFRIVTPSGTISVESSKIKRTSTN
jgi:hypothetical protein